MRTASIKLDGSATPCQAMSKAVPWATLVRTIGRPSVTLTAQFEPHGLEGDMSLVVIHRHDRIKCAGKCLLEERIVGQRTAHVQSFALC